VTALLAAVAALLIFCVFRRREDAEVPIDRPPEAGAVAAILRRENYAAQNHLAALSVMKPGWLRRFALRLSFWATAQLVKRFFRVGYLGDLGTINFARWVMVPGTGDLLFLSNYGGSWESYLEDFITKAHSGLTGIWSNTVGFPKASYLFMDGATDGDRFKRWARRQQISNRVLVHGLSRHHDREYPYQRCDPAGPRRRPDRGRGAKLAVVVRPPR